MTVTPATAHFDGPAIAYLVVQELAACRDFWTSALGFRPIVEETLDGELDFLLLHGPVSPEAASETGSIRGTSCAPIVIEYQRHGSMSEPLRARLGPDEKAVVYLWLKRGLAGLHAAIEATHPESLVEFRTAPYGADELVLSDPHGHIFIFGERHAQP